MRQETAEPTTRAIVLREGMREEQQAARNGKSAIQGERTLPDAAAHDLQAVGAPALDRLDHEEAKSVAASNAPLARVRRATARGMRWLEARTFAPRWLPPAWQQPLSGYAIATLLQLSASLATLLLPLLVPTFSFVGLLELLVVAVVAVLWGAGPSIFATLLGAVLLEWLVLPLGYGKHYAHPTDLIEIGWFLLVGLALGAVAGQTEKARRRAVEEQAEAHARELALRELGQRTDEFLSLASHELRTPLTGIKATLQLTQRRLQRLSNQRMSNHGPDQAALTSEQLTAQLAPLLEVLAGAQEQVDRENRLIGDLLDVSRIRANKLECRFAPVDLAVIVQAMVAEQRVAWPARTITLEGAEQPAPVSADPDRIAQVVTNFLTNALKYSPSGRPVTVAVRREGQRVRVLVQDQGQGLSPEQQRHIWERFHRVPGITQQSGSGTGLGLGLYIVRSIVERHGGEVDVVSAAGQGSTFSFVLPLAPGT